MFLLYLLATTKRFTVVGVKGFNIQGNPKPAICVPNKKRTKVKMYLTLKYIIVLAFREDGDAN